MLPKGALDLNERNDWEALLNYWEGTKQSNRQDIAMALKVHATLWWSIGSRKQQKKKPETKQGEAPGLGGYFPGEALEDLEWQYE